MFDGRRRPLRGDDRVELAREQVGVVADQLEQLYRVRARRTRFQTADVGAQQHLSTSMTPVLSDAPAWAADHVPICGMCYRFHIACVAGSDKRVTARARDETEGRSVVAGPDRTHGVYGISVAAELVGMGVQNLRAYEARGLLEPQRTKGGTRRYSADDLDRLHRIGDLLDAGLNLAGIAMVMQLQDENTRLRAKNRGPGRRRAAR
jgi:MerR family transcriptional regulator, heat shock protein HspR